MSGLRGTRSLITVGTARAQVQSGWSSRLQLRAGARPRVL